MLELQCLEAGHASACCNPSTQTEAGAVPQVPDQTELHYRAGDVVGLVECLPGVEARFGPQYHITWE